MGFNSGLKGLISPPKTDSAPSFTLHKCSSVLLPTCNWRIIWRLVNIINVTAFLCTNGKRQLLPISPQLVRLSLLWSIKDLRNEIVSTPRQFNAPLNDRTGNVSIIRMKTVHIKLWALLNQSPFQEMFPFPIRNIRALLYGQLGTIKTESPSPTHFESVGANLDLHTHTVYIEKFKMA